MAPKVSIIVPNYNHQAFIEERLRGLLAQTYQDRELICLDDASTDNSREIIEQVAGSAEVKTCFNDVNSGSPFAQWKKGLSFARGDYIWFAESDDLAHPTLLEALVRQLDKHAKVGIAYCNSWMINDKGAVSGKYNRQFADYLRWEQDFVADGRVEVSNFLYQRNTIPNASAVLLRRAVLEQAGGPVDAMRYAGDWCLWVRMLKYCDLSYTAEPLNYFRMGAGDSRIRRVSERVFFLEPLSIRQEIEAEYLIDAETRCVAYRQLVEVWLSQKRVFRELFSRDTWQVAKLFISRSPKKGLFFVAALLYFLAPLRVKLGVGTRIRRIFGLTRKQ